VKSNYSVVLSRGVSRRQIFQLWTETSEEFVVAIENAGFSEMNFCECSCVGAQFPAQTSIFAQR
jgi:hypothetical protein